jgi:hypothetical protein
VLCACVGVVKNELIPGCNIMTVLLYNSPPPAITANLGRELYNSSMHFQICEDHGHRYYIVAALLIATRVSWWPVHGGSVFLLASHQCGMVILPRMHELNVNQARVNENLSDQGSQGISMLSRAWGARCVNK